MKKLASAVIAAIIGVVLCLSALAEVFTLAINRILVEKGEKVKLVFCFTDGSEITQMVAD